MELIAIDWGTSALRAARLDGATGAVLEERQAEQGILSVPAGAFPAVHAAVTAGWMQTSDSLCLMSGMVGSRQGWVEAEYGACPSGFDTVASGLTWIEPGRIAIVPGLRCEHDGLPDVMRGEEVQVFGALRLLGLSDAVLVLPGTHSKWVSVQQERITNFRTCMTGELYGLLRHQSILSRMLPATDGAVDVAAFDRGVEVACSATGLLDTVFSARSLALLGRMEGPALCSYLSGLVIGEELRTRLAALPSETPLVIVGSATLTERYRRALAQRGRTARAVGSEATWRGLWALSQSLEGRA